MKKQILSLFLLLSVLCLAACQETKTEAKTTTAPPPEEPPEFVMEPGVLYYYQSHTFSPKPPQTFSFTEVTDLQRAPDDWRFTRWKITSYVEKSIPDITLQLNGIELKGVYRTTTSEPFSAAPTDFARRYAVDGYGFVYYDLKSGNLSQIDFRTSSEIDKNPPPEKLTQEECRAIAQAYINEYIATYAPDIDLSEYAYSETENNASYAHKSYGVVYDQLLDGKKLFEGTISCSVTEYGSIVYFGIGSDYSELKAKLDEIGLESYHSQLQVIADEILANNPDSNFAYIIPDGYFEKRTDGRFLYHCGINFYYLDQPNLTSIQLVFAVLLW